ncbi:Ferroporti-1 [Gaertneriomyces semiglobifer]|nr:Ferroporti-1 [Gaertneriomyces semiglobifer]
MSAIDAFEKRTILILCMNHFVTTWNVRMDEWACALLLTHIFKDTLLPVSLYGFIVTLFAILLSSYVGSLIDRNARLPVVRTALSLQCMCIAASSLVLYIVARWASHRNAVTYVLFGVSVLLGVLLRLANTAEVIAIERDWTVVIAQGDHMTLTRINGWLRRIDLGCKLVAPLAVSAVAEWSTPSAAMLAVGGWSLMALPIQQFFVIHVYRRVPALALKAPLPAGEVIPSLPQEEGNTSEPQLARRSSIASQPNQPTERCESEGLRQRIFKSASIRWARMSRLVHHHTFLSALAVAQVYLTVLSFGSPMIAYLLIQGYSSALLAAMRCVAVVVGLLATLAMPKIVARIGLIRTGLWAVWSEGLLLLPVVVSFWMPDGSLAEAFLMFGGTAASRFGLWIFDMAQMQIMQERVDSAEAGFINGMQYSMQNFFELCAFGTTMLWSNPASFHIPAIISTAAVFSAACTFSVYAYRDRGHLFHFEKVSRWGVPVRFRRRRHTGAVERA